MTKKNSRRRWWMPVKGRTHSPQALVVYLCGGVTKTAEKFGRTPSAITQWKDNGLPSELYSTILKFLPELKFADLIDGKK